LHRAAKQSRAAAVGALLCRQHGVDDPSHGTHECGDRFARPQRVGTVTVAA
jgi:hypothetical protein